MILPIKEIGHSVNTGSQELVATQTDNHNIDRHITDSVKPADTHSDCNLKQTMPDSPFFLMRKNMKNNIYQANNRQIKRNKIEGQLGKSEAIENDNQAKNKG